MEKIKQKINEKVYLPMRQGSILAYSLIIMSVMLMIAAGISSVSIISKKSASTTASSTQTLQNADSGIKIAIKIMETSLETDPIKDKFVCSGDGDVTMDTAATGLPGDITLNFFKSDGTTKVACSDTMDQIASIKSIGDFENTTRAVEVALAAGGSMVCRTLRATDALGGGSTRTLSCNVDEFATGAGNDASGIIGTYILDVSSKPNGARFNWSSGVNATYWVVCCK